MPRCQFSHKNHVFLKADNYRDGATNKGISVYVIYALIQL